MKEYCFGIDIGGTTVKCGLFNVKGDILEKWEIPTRTENNGVNILPDVAATIDAKIQEKGIARDTIALRNAAQNTLRYRQELQIVQNQQLDIRNFEENMNTFKEGFSRNYRLASQRFATAIEEIDKTIIHLQKTKDALLSSENNLRLANNKAEELSIKKLTRNAPTVRAMFEEEKKDEESCR